mgnify:CR=1 FL=1
MQNIPALKPMCRECMLQKRLHEYPQTISETDKERYMSFVLNEIENMENQQGPTVATRNIYDMQKEMFGYHQSYWPLKEKYNRMILEQESILRGNINNAEDSLLLALQYGIVGNYIDFIAMDDIDVEKLQQFIQEATNYKLDMETYQVLRNEILSAKSIVYLLDNCGEIVMDKLITECIQKLNPKADITVIVRGEEIYNDVTMDDAKQVGLTDIVSVIGNGSSVPGTCLDLVSDEVKEKLLNADVILSKGQGNFETLQGCQLNVYYIFLCKCDMVANLFHVPKLTPMLCNELQKSL